MQRVRVISLALAAVFVLVAVANAADKGAKKKGKGLRGTVKSIDTDGKSITVTVKAKKETSDKTLKVADDVQVRIGGEKKSLADVKVGDVVGLRLSEDGETVTGIVVGKKKKKNA